MGKPEDEKEKLGPVQHLVLPRSSVSSSEPRKSHTLVFFVNGKEVVDASVDPEWTLLQYLRTKLRLTGTKLGCAEGGCGACTVMVSKYDRKKSQLVHLAVNACLAPVCSMHGLSVTTIEGLGSTRTKLHPIQERLAKAHGSQCGFCTPGIIMSMYALLRTKPVPTMHDLEVAFQGNLCRCTGYRPIIEGLRTFTEEWEQSQIAKGLSGGSTAACALGDACCRRQFTSEPTEVFNSKEFTPYDPSQEVIFPPKLKLQDDLDRESLVIKGKDVTWYRPVRLEALLTLKTQVPGARIIVGNTEVGVETKFKHLVYPVLIQPTQIPELREMTSGSGYVCIGAAVTLIEMEEFMREIMTRNPEYRTRIFSEIIGMAHWFAGKQIRNVGAIGGNIMTGSPISDMVPVLMAAKARLNLCSLKDGRRQVPLDHTFFTGYRRNVVGPEEVLISIEIPFTTQSQYFIAYKQAKRRDDDIAIVNMAMNVEFRDGTDEIVEAQVAYGGVAPMTRLAVKTCGKIVGKRWDSEMVEMAYESLIEEFPLPDSVPGGQVLYRRSLVLSLFFKGFVHILGLLRRDVAGLSPPMERLTSAAETFGYKPPKSSQYYQVVKKNQDPKDLIGRPIIHASAFKQATGEAIYCDDIPQFQGELYMALVLSTRAHARLIRIDATEAMAVEGVVKFYSAEDVPDHNNWVGPVIHDEQIFIKSKVTSQGQILGAIIAADQATAQKAARLVKIDYENLEPIIVSIEDAIDAKSFVQGTPKGIKDGDIDAAFAESDHILEGEVRMGGQEHFYLETHATLAIPKETDELELYCSTQHPSEIQKLVAHTLGIAINRVNVRVKRMGGGFGGKESRGMLVALPAALAAWDLQRPVRCMLDRDEDMMISGTRHPFMHRYKVGFTKEGKIKGVKIEIFNNAGYSMDLSVSVLERAIFHCENAYKFPVTHVTGTACLTNIPSNTAFRGFGGPQGMFVAENIMWDVANYLGLEPAKVSELNLYKENDRTHYQQVLIRCPLERCWQQCIVQSNYQSRKSEVDAFNRANRYRKRGIAVIPTKFGIAFTALFLNQAGALVHIYTDGSVLISHGGTEMGQGLHTKMIQVASRIFKVDPDKIHISETATDKVPNTSATAASAGSDLNGMAVMNACNTIMARLQPIIDANPDKTWEQWVTIAYFERISLSASGFYRTPDIGYNFDKNEGMAFNYFTYGVACSEVEIDCLTGDHQVLRTDIVMDLGDSLNPAIDIGQVEGGFVQGLGLFTLEEMIYSPTGTVYSRGPGVYKIPGFADIPQEFNVSLLKDAPNPRAVFSSKAVGEPPLFLASSIFFAIKNAVLAARSETTANRLFRFDSPATSGRIRTACEDDITSRFPMPDVSKAWNKVP
ncbi:xanthine dehydrogenase [Fopius arisanus]|uniref:xanthine dehydrogenase n=1 Tax=Fopius arisanus TaxID=64838 RepID=A0A9R1TK67_9HYME|nr:PREDICTED: xanthine dehydrogenase [Fopius arisanus]XP_011310368.1 PREDICTED: xanthine dehydrogenase [Fopius arisanus]